MYQQALLKAGRLIPTDPIHRAHMMQWLFFQASGQGPMSGQFAHCALLPYAITALQRSRAPRPDLQAWVERLCVREPVRRGLAILQDQVRSETIAGGMLGYGEAHRDVLFGEKQFAERG